MLTEASVGAARDGDALRLFHKCLDGRMYVQTLVDPHPHGDACGLWSLPAEVPGGGLIDAGVAAAYANSGKRLLVLVKGFEVSDLYVHVNTVLASIHIQAIRVSDNDDHGGCGSPVADIT